MSEVSNEEKKSGQVNWWKEKIPHFLFEFLLVFLAVFCGFLADNKREEWAEQETALRYMMLLKSDLKNDTSQINNELARTDTALLNIDSLLMFLYRYDQKSILPLKFLSYDFKALLRLKVIFSDRAASQLKNSGQMQLINETVADDILNYWGQQEETMISLERYLIYRNRARQFSEQLFFFTEVDMQDRGLINGIKNVRVIRNDAALWMEYTNIVSHCHVVLAQHRHQLAETKASAIRLLSQIQKKYKVPVK